jgi:16S rRNA G966 N2-methylase RsmD
MSPSLHFAGMNRLLFGDNLKPKRRGDATVSFLPQWLRDTKVFPDASVDLVYLDPPFNANYNVLFKEASGKGSREMIPCRFETRRTVPHLIPSFNLCTER